MPVTNHVAIVEFFLTLAAAWITYAYFYKRVRLDAHREWCFSVRDALFDYMVDKGLSFEMPAYRHVRSSLNGMIRAASDGSFTLSIVAIHLHALTKDNSSESRQDRVAEAIEAIEDPEVREHFQSVVDRVGRAGFMHIWLEGPISFVLAPVIIMRYGSWDDREEEVVEVGARLALNDCELPLPATA